jgi:hypothetical protein
MRNQHAEIGIKQDILRHAAKHPFTTAMAMHGVLSEYARATIMGTGARLATTNSVPGADGVIDLSCLLSDGLDEMDRLAERNPVYATISRALD